MKGTHGQAKKQMQLAKLPQVLVLHLVRFAYGAGSSGKVNKAVSFGSTLKLKPSMLSDDCPDRKGSGNAEYALVATVSHHGRTLSGGGTAATPSCRADLMLRSWIVTLHGISMLRSMVERVLVSARSVAHQLVL